MKYIKGNDRGQIALIPTSLEEAIDENNEVRIIDLFVDSLWAMSNRNVSAVMGEYVRER